MSQDGQSVVHQAEWTSEQTFKDAGPLAREHPDFPKLMTYEPKGIEHALIRTF